MNNNLKYVSTEGIKYLGSKRKIIPYISEIVSKLDVDIFLDLFTGTTRVAQYFKQQGYSVYTNDLAFYSYIFSQCYIINNIVQSHLIDKIKYLNNLPGIDGWFTQHYAGGAKSKNGEHPIMFWQRHNTMKLDAIRAKIDDIIDDNIERSILLTSLILAMDSVDNTVGIQQAFLKNNWSKRSYNTMLMKMPSLIINNSNKIYQCFRKDACELAKSIKCDLVYLDPPYTSHNYFSYYNIWESIVLNDNPNVYGVPNKRIDVRDNHSSFNYKKTALISIENIIQQIQCKYILISYNNEGIITYNNIVDMLLKHGTVSIKSIDYKKNVMCDIGRCNLEGVRVSDKQAVRNKEFLFLLTKGA